LVSDGDNNRYCLCALYKRESGVNCAFGLRKSIPLSVNANQYQSLTLRKDRTPNPGVGGSNPSRPAREILGLQEATMAHFFVRAYCAHIACTSAGRSAFSPPCPPHPSRSPYRYPQQNTGSLGMPHKQRSHPMPCIPSSGLLVKLPVSLSLNRETYLAVMIVGLA